jgi:hypothetical protein
MIIRLYVTAQLKTFDIFKLHNYLENVQSIKEWSAYYILYVCDFIKYYQAHFSTFFSTVQFRSRLDLKNYCPSPCNLDRCDAIPNAIKESCSNLPNALNYYDFNCSCASPFYWDQAKRQCSPPDLCDECDSDRLLI